MTKLEFPRNIYYKPNDTFQPQEIPAGHFIEHSALYDLLEASTDPDANEDAFCGSDMLIIRSGTVFNTETRSAHWTIEIMNQDGDTAIITGAEPLHNSETRIYYSRQSF